MFECGDEKESGPNIPAIASIVFGQKDSRKNLLARLEKEVPTEEARLLLAVFAEWFHNLIHPKIWSDGFLPYVDRNGVPLQRARFYDHIELIGPDLQQRSISILLQNYSLYIAEGFLLCRADSFFDWVPPIPEAVEFFLTHPAQAAQLTPAFQNMYKSAVPAELAGPYLFAYPTHANTIVSAFSYLGHGRTYGYANLLSRFFAPHPQHIDTLTFAFIMYRYVFNCDNPHSAAWKEMLKHPAYAKDFCACFILLPDISPEDIVRLCPDPEKMQALWQCLFLLSSREKKLPDLSSAPIKKMEMDTLIYKLHSSRNPLLYTFANVQKLTIMDCSLLNEIRECLLQKTEAESAFSEEAFDEMMTEVLAPYGRSQFVMGDSRVANETALGAFFTDPLFDRALLKEVFSFAHDKNRFFSMFSDAQNFAEETTGAAAAENMYAHRMSDVP